jgi:integrase
MDRHLEVLDIEDSTRRSYVGYIDRYIRPVLGPMPAARVTGEVLDSLYAQLRRCRDRCGGRAMPVHHRTTAPHECDERCRPHECRPLAASTVRQIHWILSGAFERAVRWNWVGVSPLRAAEPPAPPTPNPQPPTADEAARIINDAWSDPAWGTFLWVAMTTGARRGELCGLRRSYLDVPNRMITVPRSVYGPRKAMREKDTKTHQQRRLSLDAETVELLCLHLRRQDQDAAKLGITIAPDAFLFSQDPDCATPWVPDTVTQRYGRQMARLGIDSTLHKLRHYNATELLAAGVDLRTVAGRIGHGGGGVTTLRVYAAWVNEADQRAADKLAKRMSRWNGTSGRSGDSTPQGANDG